MLGMIINIGIPVGLILLAMLVGTILERRHFRSIHQREQDYANFPVLNSREYPLDRTIDCSELVSGSVVVSVDHFKGLLAGLRKIFGGELHSYGSLLDRGRREAILRMQEECLDADMVINVRIETSSISKGQRGAIGSTEVLAYGTAIWFVDQKQL